MRVKAVSDTTRHERTPRRGDVPLTMRSCNVRHCVCQLAMPGVIGHRPRRDYCCAAAVCIHSDGDTYELDPAWSIDSDVHLLWTAPKRRYINVRLHASRSRSTLKCCSFRLAPFLALDFLPPSPARTTPSASGVIWRGCLLWLYYSPGLVRSMAHGDERSHSPLPFPLVSLISSATCVFAVSAVLRRVASYFGRRFDS